MSLHNVDLLLRTTLFQSIPNAQKDLWKQRAKAFRRTKEFKALQLRYRKLHCLSPSRPRRRQTQCSDSALSWNSDEEEDDTYLSSHSEEDEDEDRKTSAAVVSRALGKSVKKDPLDDAEITALLEKMFSQMGKYST
ncbi:MAG: hypothetical protein GY696_00555 [Gammaproteobacteria bacterium]|nr:hypothetical protein [Gammaproteobacteria bacterium]